MSVTFKPLEELINIFKPPQPISWQTLILLSIFSWAFAIFAYSLPNESGMAAAHLSNNFAFIFFIIGIFWLQTERRWQVLGIPLRPIIVGLLISIVLFKDFDNCLYFIFLLWPIISGLVSIIPEFFNNFRFSIPHPEKRHQLLTIFLIYLLISCWINFHFFLQNWLLDAPPNHANNNYLTKNLDRSIFVVRLIPQKSEKSVPTANPERLLESGVKLIQYIEYFIKTNVEKQTWDTVEVLIKNLKSELLKKQVENMLLEKTQDGSWSIKIEVGEPPEENQSNLSEYNLNLWLIWDAASESPVAIKKTCKVRQSARYTTAPNAKVFAEFICEPAILIAEG